MLNNMSNTPESIAQNISDSVPEGFGKAIADAILSAQGNTNKPPYANCSFKMCDLPGVCTGHGKCHHPDETTRLRQQLEIAVGALNNIELSEKGENCADALVVSQQALAAIRELEK